MKTGLLHALPLDPAWHGEREVINCPRFLFDVG